MAIQTATFSQIRLGMDVTNIATDDWARFTEVSKWSGTSVIESSGILGVGAGWPLGTPPDG